MTQDRAIRYYGEGPGQGAVGSPAPHDGFLSFRLMDEVGVEKEYLPFRRIAGPHAREAKQVVGGPVRLVGRRVQEQDRFGSDSGKANSVNGNEMKAGERMQIVRLTPDRVETGTFLQRGNG